MLAPGRAADIPFAPGAAHGNRADSAFADAGYCRAAADVLRLGLGAAPVDIFVQPRAGRRKKLFLADMDSTMIGQECIDELADFVGLKEKVAAITERAMRGEIAFEPALRERVALLSGPRRRGGGRGHRQPHHPHPRRPRTGDDHARPWRLCRAGVGRLHAFSPRRSPK